MMKMILMFAVMCTTGCFFPMEDIPVDDDAESPTEEVDAAPAPSPDATPTMEVDAEPIETPDATAPEADATPEETPDAAVEPPDAASETPDAAPPVTPDATPVDCSCDADCSDGYSWTSNTCAASGECVDVLTDCGGMQVRPSASAATCQFWGGFGISEPAPSLGSFAPSALPAGATGGNWKAAPEHACSTICYDSSGARVPFDLQTEWNGVMNQLAHAGWGGVRRGTFDGLNLEW